MLSSNNALLHKNKYKAPNISDNLIKKIAKKDVDALKLLYVKTQYSVFGFALSILKNKAQAEDIMQNVYIVIYEKAETYKNQGKPMAWIYTITRNLCLMEFRKQNNKTLNIDEFYDIEDNIDEYEKVEDKMLLDKVMKVLSDEERQIVTMHSLSGLKHKEIAVVLKIPLSTVLSKYNRAMNKLKQGVEYEN